MSAVIPIVDNWEGREVRVPCHPVKSIAAIRPACERESQRNKSADGIKRTNMQTMRRMLVGEQTKAIFRPDGVFFFLKRLSRQTKKAAYTHDYHQVYAAFYNGLLLPLSSL